MSRKLVNRVLKKGFCPNCDQPIDKEWSKDPFLGVLCRNCTVNPTIQVFKPEHVELVSKTTPRPNRQTRDQEFSFEWTGTQVMINGNIGVIKTVFFNCAEVQFGRQKDMISGLGNPDLILLYIQCGGPIPASQIVGYKPRT